MAEKEEENQLEMDPQDGTEHQEPTANEVVRIQQTFSRVMQKVKTAYHKELQRKKQVDLTTSVDIMKARTNQEEVHDAEANEDDEAMQTMAKEIEVTRRLLEVSQLREEQSKQIISQLETDVSKLQKLVEEEEALRRDEGLSVAQLVQLKKQLTNDNDKLSSENQVFSQQFILLQTELQEAMGDKRRLDMRLSHLQQELMNLKDELDAESCASAKTREERDALQREFEQKEADIIILRKELDTFRQDNSILSSSQSELEAKNKKLEIVSSTLASRYDQLVQEYESTKKMLLGFEDENQLLLDQLRLANGQIQERLKDICELDLYQKNASAQIEHYEQECRNASAERVLLEGQLDKLEKEVDVVRNAAKDDRQSSDKIMRENRQLHIQLHEHILAREKQGEVWQVQQETIRRLETIVREGDTQIAKLHTKLTEAEHMNARSVVERDFFRKELDVAMEMMNVKEKEYARLIEDREILEKKLQQLQTSEDCTKHEKMTIDYEVSKLKEDNYEQEKRLKTLTYMVDKLKEELSNKESMLMQGKRAGQQLERDMVTMKKTMDDQERTLNDNKTNIIRQEKQLQKLQLLLQKASNDLRESNLQFHDEKTRCANLEHKCSTQQIKIEELRYQLKDQEKMNVEQCSVTKRLEIEFSLLRGECERIDQEKKSMIHKVHTSNDLKREYQMLRETLLHEQSHRSKLENEKRMPVLFHPWRILQITDPDAYITMMRDQSEKRNRLHKNNKGWTKLPEVTQSKRPISSFSRKGPNSEMQLALIKAIL